MANILSFSDEVLCCVFTSITNVRDLHNIMLTCHRFLRIIKYCNNLWKLEVKVKDMLLSLSSKCFPVGEPSITDAQNFNCDKYPSLKGIENVLQNHVFSDRLNENMTSRFYARKVLKSLRYQKIEKKLGELMGLPESKISLLEGAVLICQWAQAEEANPISLSNVKQRLSEISNRVKELLVDRHNIADPLNITTGTAEKVLHCINEVLYEEMRFKVMQSINHTLENVFIDKVLESKAGFPMTLCIIYREVALRMGIDCEPVIAVTTRPDFHSHRFLLRWRENSNLNQGTDENNCLIDAPNGGVMRHHNPATYPLISAENFLLRMVEYMRFIRMHSIRASRREDFRTLSRLRRQNELSFSRLAYAVSSKQIQKAAFYAHLCIDLDMPLDDAIQILQRIDNVRCNRLMENCVIKAKEQAIVRKRNVQFRLPCIKYAVGLVMAYKSSTNTSPVFCVIIWWTNNGKNRTRYNVLFDGGDSSLVPEETLNLLTTGSNIVDHPNIGMYFKRYDGRRYIPNIELMTLYPEDEAFALSLMT